MFLRFLLKKQAFCGVNLSISSRERDFSPSRI
jgi:hypothetical protein